VSDPSVFIVDAMVLKSLDPFYPFLILTSSVSTKLPFAFPNSSAVAAAHNAPPFRLEPGIPPRYAP